MTEEQKAGLVKGSTRNTAAHDLYLQALKLLDQVDNPQRFNLASELLQEALALDPQFALARAR